MKMRDCPSGCGTVDMYAHPISLLSRKTSFVVFCGAFNVITLYLLISVDDIDDARCSSITQSINHSIKSLFHTLTIQYNIFNQIWHGRGESQTVILVIVIHF